MLLGTLRAGVERGERLIVNIRRGAAFRGRMSKAQHLMPKMEKPRPSPPEKPSSGDIDNLSKRFIEQEGPRKDPDLKPWKPDHDPAARAGTPHRLLGSRRRISFLWWGVAALVSLGLWALIVYGVIRVF